MHNGPVLRFNLRSVIKRLRPGTRRTRIVLQPIAPTQTKTDQLAAILQRVPQAWFVACRNRLLPAYEAALQRATIRAASELVLDDVADDVVQLRAEADAVALTIDGMIDTWLPDLRNWAALYEVFHRGRWGTALQPTGVQLSTMMGPGDVADTVESTLQANVALIRSLDSDAQTRVEGIIFRGFQARTPARDIARELAEAAQLSRARALRIAVDQTQKLSAQLDTARMQQAGIEDFEWVHSGKVHYRPWHRERNGKTFKLVGDIPPDDMPGIPIYCGCKKRAVIVLDE